MADEMTITHGKRYSATINLAWYEAFDSNEDLVSRLTKMGFADVTVDGGGEQRQAEGTWTGETMTGAVDAHLSNIKELEG